jgi:hypothetical protein
MRYTIKKGNHYASGINFGTFSGKKISRTAAFDSSCKYDLGDADQLDINKLYGFSEGLHQTNSARFGWRYNLNTDKIQLLAYVYNNGDVINEWEADTLLGEVACFTNVYTEIEVTESYYVFRATINGKIIVKSITRTVNGYPSGYLLYPYFGGNKVAPHDILIDLI